LEDTPQYVRVVPSFAAEADDMRATFDARFQSQRALAKDRFVWDYWYVADQYNYIRTHAQHFFPHTMYNAFMKQLRVWGHDNLGCGVVRSPWLSYYVHGCRQELHTDAPHGPWAYVLSLTRWKTRGFRGGETVIMRQSVRNSWDTSVASAARESRDLFDRVPAYFNQLLVFDPRIPHGVSPVEGSRDPQDSRVVLHGWFEEPGITVTGAMTARDVRAAVDVRLPDLRRNLDPGVAGLIVARLQPDAHGQVQDVRMLTNTLLAPNALRERQAMEHLQDFFTTLQFGASSSARQCTIPLRLPLSQAP
jgi:Rps23 Pro-64 3,4-dihydroxylase Tpa1-like proline 4-hydroxylase